MADSPTAIVFHKDLDSEHMRGMIVTDAETIQKFWNDEHLRTFVHALATEHLETKAAD